MFEPKYTVTDNLLANIKRIAEVSTSLNERRFSKPVLLELEREARVISSFASTSIEGNPLPLTDVKRLLKQTPATIRDTEREVLNYNAALQQAKMVVDSNNATMTVPLILALQRRVTGGLLASYSSGKFRSEPVFVNDPRSGQTVYWPPDQQDVPDLTKDLVAFVRTKKDIIDPIILAGLFHKQFVLIHPFLDGNGRTARLTTKVLLAGMGLDTFNLFSFERYYNANVTKYFATVGELGNFYDLAINFTPWLEYFTGGVLDELLSVKKELERAAAVPIVPLKPHLKKLLTYAARHGAFTDADYAKIVLRARPTRAGDLRYLLEHGLIERHGQGRATYYTKK